MSIGFFSHTAPAAEKGGTALLPPSPAKGFENIAPFAQVSAKPAKVQSGLSCLTDGKTEYANVISFAAGTKGGTEITFTFSTPQIVAGLHFCQPGKAYYTKTFRVLADVEGKGKYALELALEKAQDPPSWSGLTWKPRTIRGVRLVSVTGYASGRRAFPEVSEVVIFGKAVVSKSRSDWPQPPKGFKNIAPAARISSIPKKVQGGLGRLVDGILDYNKNSISFAAGTSGPSQITFRFLRRRTVGALYFHQGARAYVTQTFKVLADKDGKGKYSVTLASGKCPKPPCWSGVTWKPRKVWGVRLVAVKGYSTGRRAYPEMDEVLIFGEPLPSDQEDRRKSGNPISTIGAVRNLDRFVDLSGRKRPVVVLVPADAAYQDVGKRLTVGLDKRAGVRARLTTNPAQALPTFCNAIVIGNVNNNELFARLYWNFYVFADSLFPGDGEFALRTVFDPYPWHHKGDVIAIGCSDVKGAERGVEELLKRVNKEKKSLDYTLMVSSAEPPARKKLNPTFEHFRLAAWDYFKTGHKEYAQQAISLLDGICDFYNTNPSKKPQDYMETNECGKFMAAWDAFEEYPGLGDTQRLRYSHAFLRQWRALIQNARGYRWGAKYLELVTWNHVTFPLRGVYFGGRYLYDYYGLTEAKRCLEDADLCFMAQAKSWKPEEDADIYIGHTMEQCTEYWLAEWKLDFFKNGNLRKWADYFVGVSDNTGLNSGFGDSGFHQTGSLPVTYVLPIAFWYTKDGRYLWLIRRHVGDKWQNPYHRNIKPVPDKSHVGMGVFPLDKQVYEYTRRFRFYNEPLSPPNVPLEAAFDKIAFRESWRKKNQYLLLDGYSRGKHLQYDGNAINVFVDRGKRWLIDHDYLIRNTTDHNMLSIVRNGRSNKLVPSCAAIVAQAQGPTLALVATQMRDYMGIDWTRSIFWNKGKYFVVMESMAAREPGDYDFDLTWKFQDMGTERIAGPGVFRVDRPDMPGTVRDIQVVSDETASRGKAIVFAGPKSEWSFVVELPPDTYLMKIFAYGLHSSGDSLFGACEGTPKATFHTPKLRYGVSASKYGEFGTGSVMRFTEGNRHVVRMWLREQPPVRVDKVVFYDKDDKPITTIEAEDAPRPTPEDIARFAADRFWLKCADALETRITRYTTRGIIIPLCKLWQRASAKLAKDAEVEMANLFYTDTTQQPVSFEIRRVGRRAVLVTGDDTAFFAVHQSKLPGFESDAELVHISPERVAFAGGTFVKIGNRTVRAAAGSHLEQTVDGPTRAAVGAFLKSMINRAKAAGWTVGRKPAKRTQPLWSFDAGKDATVKRLRVADLDEDGQDDIVVAAGTQVIALAADGKELWRYGLGGKCNDVHAGNATDAPGLEVVAGAGDNYLYLLDSKGRLITKKEIIDFARGRRFDPRPYEALAVAILNTDGTPRIFAATSRFDVKAYDTKLNPLATGERCALHGGMDLLAVDVDGDGKKEVLSTDRYGHLHTMDHEGKRIFAWYCSIGDMQAGIGDIDGDGRIEGVYGSSTGDLHVRRYVKRDDGKLGSEGLWTFNNYGYPVNRIRIADLDGDGPGEVIVASGTGYLYVLDGKSESRGKVKWQRRAQTNIADVVVLPGKKPRLAYIDSAGSVTVIDGRGKEPRTRWLDGSPQMLVECEGRLVISLENRIVALPVAQGEGTPTR